jgi:AhpD family alkylhydroperoxidase
MSTRGGVAPDVCKALIRLDTAARRRIGLALLTPVKIRASRINHCAFRLDMHSKDALADSESPDRIMQLSAWSKSNHSHTAKGIAVVELTEAVGWS